MVIRIIRLYPTYLLSFSLCTAIFFLNIERPSNLDSFGSILATVVLTAFLIPSNFIGGGALFHLNGPYWSLFYEMVFNYFYAVAKARLSGMWQGLVLLVFLSLIAIGAARNGNLDIGSNMNAGSLIYGSSRAAFGIFFGAWLFGFHARWSERPLDWRIPGALSLGAIMLALCSPSVPNWDWVIDLIVVCVVFPTCILVGAKAAPPRLGAIFDFLGAASYPLYLLHVPARNLLQWVARHESFEWMSPHTGIVFAAALFMLCVWIERAYDFPIRTALRRRHLTSSAMKRSA